MEKVIELKNVDKHFGTNHVLNKISLTINSGQLVGLIGPSGAGKSTLIAAMLGMLRLDGGQVRLLNSDMLIDQLCKILVIWPKMTRYMVI